MAAYLCTNRVFKGYYVTMNEPSNQATQQTKTILVVEDEAPMRKMLSGALQQAGFAVVEATNGKDGLAVAVAQQPALIVTDNFMPVMNGVEMVAELRKQAGWGANVPVILMTNVNDMDAVNKALQTGGIDYLMKADVQLDQIVTLAKQRLGGK